MMEQKIFEETLTLYLVNYVSNYRDSYNLTKVLSRKFGIINFSEISNSLFEKGFISRVNNNGIYIYKITGIGIISLNEKCPDLIKKLYNYAQNDKEYIETLISHYKS